jgi:hypothetical protein
MPMQHRKNRSLHLSATGLSESQHAEDSPTTPFNQDNLHMLYTLSWILVFSLVALWSLAAWAMHGVAAWALSNAGVLAGTTSGAVSGDAALRPPEWLAPWVPPEIAQAMNSLLSALTPAIESLLQAAPALAGGLTVATWVIWGLGSALLVLLGAGLHLLVAVWRRRGVRSSHQPARQLTA